MGGRSGEECQGAILAGQVNLFKALEKPVPAGLEKKVKEEDQKKAEFYKVAEELELERDLHDNKHNWIAGGVTFFQVAVAISAIAILTKRRWFWYLSLVFGAIAMLFVIYGQFLMPAPKASAEEKPEKTGSTAIRMDAPSDTVTFERLLGA